MASIQRLIGKNGDRWRVQVRLAGEKELSKCFVDYETAVIWGKYQEMIHKEKEAFGARCNDMYTIADVLSAKYGDRSREYTACMDYFSDLNHLYLGQITTEMLLDQAKMLLKKPVRRGGGASGTGRVKLPAPGTVMRKFAYLSSAIGYMNKHGADLENNTLKAIAYLRELEKNGPAKEPTRRKARDRSRARASA